MNRTALAYSGSEWLHHVRDLSSSLVHGRSMTIAKRIAATAILAMLVGAAVFSDIWASLRTPLDVTNEVDSTASYASSSLTEYYIPQAEWQTPKADEPSP
jgi:hypothetical protein